MDLDQSGVPTDGSLVPKEGGHTLPHNTLLVYPPWCSKPPFFVGSRRSFPGQRPLVFHRPLLTEHCTDPVCALQSHA